MKWTATSSGREAFDAVLAHLKAGPMKGVDFRKCTGLLLWDRFLMRNHTATLAECLTEFEKRQPREGNAAWPLILMEALGFEADDHFRSRVIATADGDAAGNVISSAKANLSHAEIEALHSRRHKGTHRPGKVAPPDAKRPGRAR